MSLIDQVLLQNTFASNRSIYVLTLLTDEDFTVAVKEVVVNSTASVRFITYQSKTRKLHGNAVDDEIPIVLIARES